MVIPGSLSVGPLSRRAMSGFPLSIGTSLAFESLFDMRQAPYDPARPLPPHIDVTQYKVAYINLATLFRNIVGAIDKVDFLMVSPAEIREVIEMEIEIINSLFAVEGHNSCTPVYYYATYDTLYRKHLPPAVKFRQDKTDGQKHYAQMLLNTFKPFFIHPKPQCFKIDTDLPKKEGETALLLSHVPYDLLNWSRFRRLDLLESHTGKVKGRNLWHTKYANFPGEALGLLPFTWKLLLIFGDQVMFQPMDIRFRRMIVDIAKNRRWTAMTTESKLLMDLGLDLKEPYLLELYRSL